MRGFYLLTFDAGTEHDIHKILHGIAEISPDDSYMTMSVVDKFSEESINGFAETITFTLRRQLGKNQQETGDKKDAVH